jgi:ABC-type bacteriocin/lantibiotic exporter with double-glycine peptidase domain
MMIVMALLDMLGVASIFPFVAVLTNPELIETNFILQIMFKVSSMFGVESKKQFLFVLAILVFVLLITSLMFKALTTYFQIRFVQMLQYKISKHLVQGYLQQPYGWFLSRHSADLGKNILSEVSQLVGGGINPIMDMAAKILVTSSIISLLIFTDPKLALIICFLLGGAYSLFFYASRDYLKRIGKKRLESNEMRFTAVSEAFGAIKEIKVSGLEEVYIRTFSNPSKTLAQTQASFTVLSQLPRYLLEIVAFGGILLIIIYMMAQSGNLNSVLPMISLYVFAGYRLMPAMQQIYNSFTKITFTGPALNNLYYDLKNLKKMNYFRK